MKLHILLTVNCSIDEIDPALTRRGRLLGYYEFGLCTRTEALAIAEKHGLVLPDEDVDELSLSDIFAEAEPRTEVKKTHRPMGFAV